MSIDAGFLESLNQPLKKIVQDAANAIMDVYRKDEFESEIKSDGSPVTEADNNANKIIVDALKEITPNVPIVSEETYKKELDAPSIPYWLVDPLDGTREFLNKSEDFTVNIALIENTKAIFGIICAPISTQIWLGSKFNISRNEETIPDSLRIVMSKSHQTDKDKMFLDYLNSLNVSYEIIEKGSSLKLCALADNKADIYPRFGPTSEWDIAAGHAILNAYGGSISQMANTEDLRYSKEESILNPAFAAFRNEAIKDQYSPILSEFYKKLV
jgi:3'(2'), 5'-bisphosphate nucleotidase